MRTRQRPAVMLPQRADRGFRDALDRALRGSPQADGNGYGLLVINHQWRRRRARRHTALRPDWIAESARPVDIAAQHAW